MEISIFPSFHDRIGKSCRFFKLRCVRSKEGARGRAKKEKPKRGVEFHRLIESLSVYFRLKH